MSVSIDQLASFLFYNPWSPFPVMEAFLNLSWAGERRLKDEHFFERLRIPAETKRGYQDAYALTADGQKELVGRYRSPRALGEALLLQYDRLARARAALCRLQAGGFLSWTISPWRPFRRSAYLD